MAGQKVSDVVASLKGSAGDTWRDAGWDGLQAGRLDAEVTGIAVAWTPAVEVLKRAKRAGCNLLITKDPLYWWEKDSPWPTVDSVGSRISEGNVGATQFSAVEASPGYKEKHDLVMQSGMNVLRMSENWNAADGLALSGLMAALQWKAQDTFVADPQAAPHAKTAVVLMNGKSLLEVAQEAKTKVGAKSVRVLGDKSAKVSKAAVHPGFLTIAAVRHMAEMQGVDLVVTGEGCEWEAFPFLEDWVDGGHGKGMVMLGLAVTSDTSARAFADWVRIHAKPLRVEFLPVGDPFTPVFAGGLRA